jgi:hypothetical protein
MIVGKLAVGILAAAGAIMLVGKALDKALASKRRAWWGMFRGDKVKYNTAPKDCWGCHSNVECNYGRFYNCGCATCSVPESKALGFLCRSCLCAACNCNFCDGDAFESAEDFEEFWEGTAEEKSQDGEDTAKTKGGTVRADDLQEWLGRMPEGLVHGEKMSAEQVESFLDWVGTLSVNKHFEESAQDT